MTCWGTSGSGERGSLGMAHLMTVIAKRVFAPGVYHGRPENTSLTPILQQRLEEACNALHPWPEALFSHSLGTIAYRLGDAPTA